MRYLAATLLSALMAAVSAGGASAEPTWQLEQPPPPPGSSFAVPLGKPGDLQFLAPNHGLLAVSGNATVPAGLYFYDGAGWRQLSTVCGGPGRTTRIAIAEPARVLDHHGSEQAARARPRAPRSATSATARWSPPTARRSQSPDPFREVTAAACTGPSNCWFGGVGAEDATGERRGAFHLHWDGSGARRPSTRRRGGACPTSRRTSATPCTRRCGSASRPADRSGHLDLVRARAGAAPDPQDRRRELLQRPVHGRGHRGAVRRHHVDLVHARLEREHAVELQAAGEAPIAGLRLQRRPQLLAAREELHQLDAVVVAGEALDRDRRPLDRHGVLRAARRSPARAPGSAGSARSAPARCASRRRPAARARACCRGPGRSTPSNRTCASAYFSDAISPSASALSTVDALARPSRGAAPRRSSARGPAGRARRGSADPPRRR